MLIYGRRSALPFVWRCSCCRFILALYNMLLKVYKGLMSPLWAVYEWFLQIYICRTWIFKKISRNFTSISTNYTFLKKVVRAKEINFSSLCKFRYFSFYSQKHLPNKKDVKVSCGPIETLVLSCGEAKAHGEDRQGQGEQPSEDKQDRPNGETAKQEDKF